MREPAMVLPLGKRAERIADDVEIRKRVADRAEGERGPAQPAIGDDLADRGAEGQVAEIVYDRRPCGYFGRRCAT